jgi:hypothetical protein
MEIIPCEITESAPKLLVLLRHSKVSIVCLRRRTVDVEHTRRKYVMHASHVKRVEHVDRVGAPRVLVAGLRSIKAT